MSVSDEVRFLTCEQVARRLSLSKSTIWRYAKELQDFPKPKKVGSLTRWLLSEVEAFEALLQAS